jgi:outer membrane protein insertion porin family
VAHAHAATNRHVLVVAMALAACHHGQVHHPGEEYLAAIELDGNHAISAGSLRSWLALDRARKSGTAADPYLVSQDGERIKGMYERDGYLEVEVHSRIERHGDAATVIYRIDEGPRAKVRVEIEGLPQDPALTREKVRHQLPLADGAPFVYDVYDKAKEPLLAVAQNAGYAHAQLHTEVVADRTNHEAIVRAVYDVGTKCTFGDVSIAGVDGELRDAITARIKFARGDQFSEEKLAATQRAIYAMKRFSTVRVQPDKTDGDVIAVRITVGMGASHEVSLGGGFGIDPLAYEVRGRAGYSIIGWPFPLTNLDIDTRPAYAYLRDGEGYEPRVRALITL